MTLTVLSGPSGSGKSTYARELLSRSPAAEVISADQVRQFCPDLDPADVTFRLIEWVGVYLRDGCNVIVDACNLHPHDKIRWESVALACSAELRWIALDTPTAVCITRDAQRADPVGATAIIQQLEMAHAG